jgi:hypothetical protein
VQGCPGKTPDREAETLTAFLAAVAPRRTTCCRADPLAGEDAIDPEALGETSAEHPASTFGFVTRRSCHDIVDVPFCVAAATGPAMIGLN